MDWEDKQERAMFLSAFRALTELHGKDVSDNLTRFYHTTLADHSIADVLSAFKRAATETKFFPKPVELLEFIGGSVDELKVQAEQQAQEVLMAVRQKGRYANVLFADPTTQAVVKGLGGWQELCNQKQEDEKWFIKNFVDDYPKYKRQGVEDKTAMRGIGTSEAIELVGFKARRAIECESNKAGLNRLSLIVGGMKR